MNVPTPITDIASSPQPRRVRRTQAERSAEARAILIEIAIQQIRERGLAYVTMAEIADHAGMTRGAIQHHFGGRDDYMRAVLSAITDRVADRLKLQPPADKGAPDKLVQRCVRELGRIVLSPEQLAVTDITISTRSVPMLLEASARASTLILADYGAAWHRWLDGAYPPTLIEKGFDIFRMFCSGILVINYGKLTTADHEDSLALCAELVESTLVGPKK